ncbi:MAG: peptidylprolyl isomerase [Acidobacteriota bacterium]|nr:peptidylprolyl isomerase [Acidobacteriota bacterium]
MKQKKESYRFTLHLGVAEQGKLFALEGNYTAALTQYREAMRLSVSQKAPEVFFRHYMTCSLEALEHMGAFEEVLAYCDKAVDHFNNHPPQHDLARADLADTYQRKGIVLLKSGHVEAARKALQTACRLAERTDHTLPLATTVLRWLQAGLHVSGDRLLQEQERCHYFSVHPDHVDPKRAINLNLKNPLTQETPRR